MCDYNELDDEIIAKMLLAMTYDAPTNLVPVDETSLDEKIRYIERNVDAIARPDRIAVGNILRMHGRDDLMKQSAEGLVMNINDIPAFIITEMYNFISYKIDTRS